MSAFPTGQKPRSDRLRSNQPTLETFSQSGVRQSRIVAAHLWEYKATYPSMERVIFAPIIAFSEGLRGASFTTTVPNLLEPLGTVTGSINNNGIGEAGSKVIHIEGFVAGTADVFKAGDILKSDNHSKVYRVIADASAGATVNLLDEDSSALIDEDSSALIDEGSGQASISINPPLREEITDGINITYTSVPFTMAFKGDIQEWKTSRQGFSTFEIDLIEAL